MSALPPMRTFRASPCQRAKKTDIPLPHSITSSARAVRAHNGEKRKIDLRCSAIGRHASMGQLLVTLIVPPIHPHYRSTHLGAGRECLQWRGPRVEPIGWHGCVFGDGIQGAVPPGGQSNVEASYKFGGSMETVTCHCGALYETIETTSPPKDQSPFKCVLCEKELSTRTNVQFRLRQQPEQDRA